MVAAMSMREKAWGEVRTFDNIKRFFLVKSSHSAQEYIISRHRSHTESCWPTTASPWKCAPLSSKILYALLATKCVQRDPSKLKLLQDEHGIWWPMRSYFVSYLFVTNRLKLEKLSIDALSLPSIAGESISSVSGHRNRRRRSQN
jgi:hypothetical protein